MSDEFPQGRITRGRERVLVVDDSTAGRELLRHALLAQGLDVVTAPDGASALALVDEQSFDLVLLDLVMPGLDGMAVLRSLRRRHPLYSLPVIMVTAASNEHAHVEAFAQGANDYVTKPLQLPLVLARAQAQLTMRRAEERQRWANAKLMQAVRELSRVKRELEQEVEARRRSEALLQQLALHDVLTGLGNRLLLREAMAAAMARLSRNGEGFGLLCLDLDGLKRLNDSLGHDAGDEYLRLAARRMRACLRESDVVARIGGDEFAVVQADAKSARECESLARRLISSIGSICQIMGHEVVASCSIGIAVPDRNDRDPDVLLKRADIALYQAKADGRGAYRFFDAASFDARSPGDGQSRAPVVAPQHVKLAS